MANDYIRKQDAVDRMNHYGSIWMEYTEAMSKHEVAEQALKASKQAVIDVLENLPSADVAPVVHARWIKPTGMMPPEYHGHYECSACGTWAGRDWLRPWKEVLLTDHCPGCGAKMDGD